MNAVRKFAVSALFATSLIVSAVPSFAQPLPELEKPAACVESRKVNEYEGQHRLSCEVDKGRPQRMERKVNEYEGQH